MLQTLIPVKPLADAKSRLEEVLTPGERSALVLAMLGDLLQTLRQSRLPGPIGVVCDDPAVLALAHAWQVDTFPDGTQDLNRALQRAIQASAASGVEQVLLLHADLPLLTPDDIQLLIGKRTRSTIRMAPSRDGGTNALLTKLPLPIPLMFGRASLQRHRMAARERHVAVRLVHSPGLAYDIDRPEDLLGLLHHPGDGETKRLVRQLGMIERVMSI